MVEAGGRSFGYDNFPAETGFHQKEWQDFGTERRWKDLPSRA